MKKLTLLCSLLFGMGMGAAQAQVTNLHSFYDSAGEYPYGDVTLSGNNLYGMTYEGGTNGEGTIFFMHTDGTGYKVLWNFDNGYDTNGSYPYSSLLLYKGKLYGMTPNGGINREGNVFRIDTDGSNYKDLWNFDNGGDTNGAYPYGALIAVGHNLYGMTYQGGVSRDGNIFRIDTNGSNYKDLFDFNYTDGANPYADLLFAGGKLFGTAYRGGVYNDGILFSVDSNGANFKDLFSFNSTDGADPYGSLIISGKKLFGTAANGGDGYDDGVVFSIDSNGSNFKDIVIFNYANGEEPYGSLVLSGNLLYGMAEYNGPPYYDGNIFSVDTAGNQFSTIFNFDIAHGEDPYASLVRSGGSFYGMTADGGDYGWGVVFKEDVCNLLVAKHDSTADDGSSTGSAGVTVSGGPTPYSYVWAPGGQTTSSISGLSAGTYTCTTTDANGCQNVSAIVVNSSTGINNIASIGAQVTVYPNPSNGNFNVIVNGKLSMVNGMQVEVYNELGQQVYSNTIVHSSSFIVNLSSQSNGVYLYRIISDNGNLIGQGKLVIAK